MPDTWYSITNGNWNANSSWSASSGGSAGSDYPKTGDLVYIESPDNVTLTGDEVCGYLNLAAGGTLTGGGNKLTIDSINSGSGTNVNNNGTISGILDVDLTYSAAASEVDLAGSSGNIRHFVYNASGRSVRIHSATTFDGNFTITAGTFDTHDTNNYALTVTGDTLISSGGTLTGNASAISAGSITIASGGTYSATSGTTSLTSGAGAGTWVLQNGGTFTHNNGTIKVTSTEGSCHIQSNTFYNVTVAMGDSTDATKWRDNSGNTTTILGDLVIEEGIFKRDSNGDDLIIHGFVDVQSGGTFWAAAESGDNTFNSLVTNAGTFLTSTGANNFNAGIRALSAITSDDTITINGTGGILEGSLDDAIINVNTDAPYTLDGAADWFYVADHNDFDLSATLTMSAWIKPTGDGPEGWQIIMTKNGVSGDADRPYAFWYKQADNRVYLYLGDDSANTAMNSGAESIVRNAWNHVAATFDNSSNTGKLYVNGVLKATSTSMTTSPYNSTKHFSIGALLDNSTTNGAEFKGEIVDAKLFSDVLTDAEVQEISSKINYDISRGSIGNLVGWWKLMGAATDSSGNSHNLTAVGSPASDYDAFSVNVQDYTTTTDGAVTVTQGKLEGLSLTSHNFDGGSDWIDIGAVERTADTTISMWINPDEFQNNRLIGDDAGSANDYLAFKDNSSSLFKVSINGNNANF